MIKTRNIAVEGLGSKAISADQQYMILKPSISATFVVATEDISGGDVTACSIARGTLDYPRNLLYTLTDASGSTLEGTFTVVGTDQFDQDATETVIVDVSTAATMPGTQVFKTITSVALSAVANEAASDTASLGVNITADVASFGLPEKMAAITDIVNINWLDAGVTKAQNIDTTSVVLARQCFRPEQTVVAADDFVITYKSTLDN